MADKPKPDDKDERLSIPLDPEEALRALMQVDPDADPVALSPPTEAHKAERPAEASLSKTPAEPDG